MSQRTAAARGVPLLLPFGDNMPPIRGDSGPTFGGVYFAIICRLAIGGFDGVDDNPPSSSTKVVLTVCHVFGVPRADLGVLPAGEAVACERGSCGDS